MTAYKYLCDESEDKELKDALVEACTRMTDLILEDNRYYIIDATGKSTQWSRWLSRYFNDGLDMMKKQDAWKLYGLGLDAEGEDALSYGYEDGPLNALEVMGMLKVASYISNSENDTQHAQIYDLAYNQCFESPYSGGQDGEYVNGKGYIDMALEYIERRIIRQNNDAYNENNNKPVEEYTPGNKIFNNALHDDWTQYVNYSDEELAWFPLYSLIILEDDSGKRNQIVKAFDQWYENQMEREENPFYTYLYQLAHPEKNTIDLNATANYFYRSPLIRNRNLKTRADRQDVLYIEAGNRDDNAQTNRALTLDELDIRKNNSNPFSSLTQFGEVEIPNSYAVGSLDCGSIFTLSYWFGRYYGLIEDTNESIYQRVNPTISVKYEDSKLVADVHHENKALPNVIVDFYDKGNFVGRARTDENGSAVLETTKVSSVKDVYAETTERLVDETIYSQVSFGDKPSVPIKPVDPSDPTGPKDPVDPSDPTGPKDPVNPSNPTEPKDPVDPSDTAEPKKPVENVKTGVDANILGLLGLLGVSIVAGTIIYKKKKESDCKVK